MFERSPVPLLCHVLPYSGHGSSQASTFLVIDNMDGILATL